MISDFGLMQGKPDPQDVEVSWHEYPIQHPVCAEEIEDIRSWLLKIFSEVTDALTERVGQKVDQEAGRMIRRPDRVPFQC